MVGDAQRYGRLDAGFDDPPDDRQRWPLKVLATAQRDGHRVLPRSLRASRCRFDLRDHMRVHVAALEGVVDQAPKVVGAPGKKQIHGRRRSERDRLLASSRQRGAGRGDEEELFHEHRFEAHSGELARCIDDRHVHPTGHHHLAQHETEVVVDEQADARVLLSNRLEQGCRQDRGRAVRRQADRTVPEIAPGARATPLGAFELVQHQLRVSIELATSIGVTPMFDRSSSFCPKWLSSAAICWLRAGCAIFSAWAAAETLVMSTAVTKLRRVLKFTATGTIVHPASQRLRRLTVAGTLRHHRPIMSATVFT
jgi:hypothetical protein